MPLPQPDHLLLRRAQKGDERAFQAILEMYERPVFNYVLRMVGDRALAEDLTQEIFLRIYQGLPGFSLRCRFTTWLFQVAKNRVLDELRARERKPQAVVTLDDLPPLEVVDAPPERIEIDRRRLARRRPPEPRPEDGAPPPRRRRPLLHRDRRLARDHARHGQVADLQGARRGAARARARGHRGRGLAPAHRAREVKSPG